MVVVQPVSTTTAIKNSKANFDFIRLITAKDQYKAFGVFLSLRIFVFLDELHKLSKIVTMSECSLGDLNPCILAFALKLEKLESLTGLDEGSLVKF